MLFSSTVFLFLFLPIVLVAYYATPRAGKNVLLVVASLFFYFWGEAFFVLVMVLSILANYGFGLLIDRARSRRAARLVVALAVVLNLGLLCAYKYLDFLIELANAGLAALGLRVIEYEPSQFLPVGISFFTFQALSYVIDVYRGDAKVQKDPLGIALYISMFPQLIAGPIVRYQEIADQLAERKVDVTRVWLGVRRFVIGLGKKVLIASPLSLAADGIFDGLPASELTPAIAWFGVFCYMLQLYFDFSGYSDMAIGLGHMFGFQLPENFNYPFIARSVRDIWRRWHMSLTLWFRDYLYFPMGGSRCGNLRTYFNLVTVFVLVGLWHGAKWNFVVFGLFHGVLLVSERIRALSFLARTPRPLQHAYTLLVWMSGLVIFRTSTLEHALEYSAVMWGAVATTSPYLVRDLIDAELLIVIPFAVLASMPVARLVKAHLGKTPTTEVAWSAASFVAVTTVFVLCAAAMAATTHQSFIYFRF